MSGHDAHGTREGSVPSRGNGPTRSQLAEADPEQAIGLSLSGPMPCISCGYDLQGLSVVGVCPECGAAVRATILAKIDPQAEELAPLLTPRLTAYGLAGGVLAGAVATFAFWALRAVDALSRFTPLDAPAGFVYAMRWLALVSLIAAGAGAMALIRPWRKTGGGQIALALLALPCFAVMLWAAHRVVFLIDATHAAPYFAADVSFARTSTRLVFTGAVIGALLCVRPAARRLARRSMAMRAGRLNRQTVFAMCGALLVASLGDCFRLATLSTPSGFDDALDIAGTLLIFAGSTLFTVGAVLSAADAVRVARVLLRPAPSLRQVVAGAARPPAPPVAPGAPRR